MALEILNVKLKPQHIAPLIPALVLLASSAMHAQANDCAALVRGAYQRMMGSGTSAGAACRLRYVVRTVSRLQGQVRTTVSNVELIATNTRLALVSDQMELYQDAGTSVIVVPARKSISIGTSNLERLREARGSSLTAMRDSVLAASEVTECASLDGGTRRKVTYRLRPAMRDRLKMSSVTIYLNTGRGTIERLQFAPTAKSAVVSVDIEFTSVDYNYATDRFARPLLAQFIDGAGRPTGRYRGYTVNDARRK